MDCKPFASFGQRPDLSPGSCNYSERDLKSSTSIPRPGRGEGQRQPGTGTPHQHVTPPRDRGCDDCDDDDDDDDDRRYYDSPDPESDFSEEGSRDDLLENGQSPRHTGSPIPGTTADFGRVSLEQRPESSHHRWPSRGRGNVSVPSNPSKRSASTEPSGRAGCQPGTLNPSSRPLYRTRATNFIPSKVQKRAPHDRTSYDRLEQLPAASIANYQRRMVNQQTVVRPFVQSHDRPKKETAIHRDSGYETAPSRENTGQYPDGSTFHSDHVPPTIQELYQPAALKREEGLVQLPPHGRYAGLILQPDSSPISQEQLAAEVKGIYAGLVMVEAKCINIDAAQASDPKQQLGAEQWQALIALHRTLLYEHHDFLMATQHPSATPALRGLATKYSMPARMWKHGIHAFLEVLRHRRPESQDYMLAFIYLSYQMMALLFETVPSFTDTWIECLGDLARYRMAIEEEKEAHATWGGVAARWYTLASDRHPAIGRLYHHLGILERPSLRKFCLYAKSLTCVIPFTNARDSLTTLCGPIVQDELTVRSSTHSIEARAVTFHALVSSRCDPDIIRKVEADALRLLSQETNKVREYGAYLAITNIASLFELGSPTNLLFQQYTVAINQAMQQSRPSMVVPTHPGQVPLILPHTTPSIHLKASEDFWADSFNTLLQSYNPMSVKDFLPFVHVMLVGIHSLYSLRSRLLSGQSLDTFQSPVDVGRLSWGGLADFLNTLAQQERITSRILECARQGVFLAPERKEEAKPLSEDYFIRGLIWGQFYFSPGWFDGQSEDDGRAIETQNMQTARSQRVLWLGLYLAFHTDLIQYDVQNKIFSSWSTFVGTRQTTRPTAADIAELAPDDNEQVSMTPNAGSRTSQTASSSPSSDDGYLLVKPPKDPDSLHKAQESKIQSWAKVAAKPPKFSPPRKHNQDINAFKVADEDGMIWAADGDGFRPSFPNGIRPDYSGR